VTWSILDKIAKGSISATGLVTAFSNGFITVQATANDGSGVTGTFVIEVRQSIEEPFLAIVDQYQMSFLLDEKFSDCKVSIFDLNGSLISSKQIDGDLCVFDITNYRSGLYIAVLSNKTVVRKVTKVIIL
jgi:hypothetical protein